MLLPEIIWMWKECCIYSSPLFFNTLPYSLPSHTPPPQPRYRSRPHFIWSHHYLVSWGKKTKNIQAKFFIDDLLFLFFILFFIYFFVSMTFHRNVWKQARYKWIHKKEFHDVCKNNKTIAIGPSSHPSAPLSAFNPPFRPSVRPSFNYSAIFPWLPQSSLNGMWTDSVHGAQRFPIGNIDDQLRWWQAEKERLQKPGDWIGSFVEHGEGEPSGVRGFQAMYEPSHPKDPRNNLRMSFGQMKKKIANYWQILCWNQVGRQVREWQ